ncbi:hypothetical protein ACFE04_005273 [Oxalis oulophora]
MRIRDKRKRAQAVVTLPAYYSYLNSIPYEKFHTEASQTIAMRLADRLKIELADALDRLGTCTQASSDNMIWALDNEKEMPMLCERLEKKEKKAHKGNLTVAEVSSVENNDGTDQPTDMNI